MAVSKSETSGFWLLLLAIALFSQALLANSNKAGEDDDEGMYRYFTTGLHYKLQHVSQCLFTNCHVGRYEWTFHFKFIQ